MKPISQMGYEQARDELFEVVRRLEQGGHDLDTSLKLWERGEELAKRCEEHLEQPVIIRTGRHDRPSRCWAFSRTSPRIARIPVG